MRRAGERNEYPFSMRLPVADIAIIDRAATLRGRSRTDFVREAAFRQCFRARSGRVSYPILFHAFCLVSSPRIKIGPEKGLVQACSSMRCNVA